MSVGKPAVYDRALLLGRKRNEVLTLEEVTRYGWVIPARPGSNITFAQDIVTCDDGSVRNGYGHDISKSRVWGNQYPIARKLRDMPVCDPGQHEVLPRLSQIRCVAD